MASTNYEKKYNPSGLLINKEDNTWMDWNNQSGTNVQEFIKGELEKAVVDFEYENSVLYGINSLGERVVSADVNVIKPSYRFVNEDAILDIMLNGSTTPISGEIKNVNATSSLVVKTRFKWHLIQTVGDKDSDSKNSVKYRAFLIKPGSSDGEKFASNGLELSGQANYSESGFNLDISKLFSKNEISSGTVQLRVVLSYSYVNDSEELIEEQCILDSATKLNVKRIELSYPSDKGLLQNSTITFNLSGIDASDAEDFEFRCGVLVGTQTVSVSQKLDTSDTSQVLFNIASAVPGAITKDVQTINLCARVVNKDVSLFSDWLTVSALYQSPSTIEAQAGATVAISYVPESVSNCDSANLFNVVTTDKMQGEMIVHVFKSNKESDIQNISTDPTNSNYYMKDKMQNYLFKTINMSLNGAEASKTEKYFSYLEMEGINESNNTIYLAFVIQTGSDATNAEVSRFCVPGSTGSINSKAVRAIKITNPKNASELMHVAEGKIIDYSQIATNKKFNQYGEFKELFDYSNLHPNIDSTDGMTQDGKYMGFKISPLGTESRNSDSFQQGDPNYETPSDIVPINLFKKPIKLQDAAGTLLPSTGAFSIEMVVKTYNVNNDDDFILSIGNLRLYPHYLRLWSRDLGYENGSIEFSTPYIASCANFSKDEITHIMITYDGNYKPSRYQDTVYEDLYPNFGESYENGGPKNTPCLKIYINGTINRSVSIDPSQLYDFNNDFSLQIHPSNSNINIYGFRTYSKCLNYDQIQRNRISAFASLDSEKLPYLEVNDLLYKSSDYTSDGWTAIYNAGLANTISIRKCLGIPDERYADKTKKYSPKNVMLIVTDDEGPLYYGNKKFSDYLKKADSMKYHDAAMFIKYAHNAEEENDYASKYNGKFIGIYQARENGYAEYYKAQGSSAKRYGGAFNVQFSKFYFIPESKLSLFSQLVDNKLYDANAASEWVETTTTDENDNTITTYKTNVQFDFNNPLYLQEVVEKDGKKSYKEVEGAQKYDKKFNTVMEKIAKKKYILPTDPSKAEVKKLVGKVNYASSMQSHKQGACDLYAGCYPLGGNVANDYMLRRAVKEDVFYYFYIKRSDCKVLEGQTEVTFRNITWDNINWDKVRFFGIQTWGSAKMDKATFGLNDDVDLEYLNIEGADNKNSSTNFKCPWAAQQVWTNSEAVNRDDPYYSSIEGNYKNPEKYINQFQGYKYVDGKKVPDYITGLLIDDETLRYKKPSEDETTKGADAIEKGPDSWDIAGNAVEETHSAHYEFIKWGEDFTDINGIKHSQITPIEKSFNSFARFYNAIYTFDFGNLELLLENDEGNKLDLSVPGISESKKYVMAFTGDLVIGNKTYQVNAGDVFRWDQVFEKFVPAGLYYTNNDWETFNIGTEYDEIKKAVVDNDSTSKYWELYSKGLENYNTYTNTNNSDFFTKGSSLLTKGEGESYHYFRGDGSEAGNLSDNASRDSIFEMFRGAFADMFKCAIWAYCDVNSFAYHQAAIRFLSGTDNRAKNIYFVLKGDTYREVEAKVYKLDEKGNRIPILNEESIPTGEYVTENKTYYEIDPDQQSYHNRYLWTLFQDDLDTIFATDNNGQQSKDYNLLEPIYNNETMGYWGDSRSGLWYNFDLIFEPEIKHHLKRIVDWAISSGSAGNGAIYDETNNLYKSFLKIQKESIPSVTYNHMSEIYYDTMQFVYHGGKISEYGKTIKGFNDNVFNNNLVANPESLVHGGCFESEKQFLKKRIALLASYCSDFKSEDSQSSIKPLGKTGGGDQLKIQMKMKDLSFIQDFYPNVLGNKVNDLKSRTYADPIVLTYNPPEYISALSRSGDKYEIDRFELSSSLTSRDSIEHTDYYKTITFTEGVSSVSELAMNNVSELHYELPDYLSKEEFEQYIYKEGSYDNRGINFKPVSGDDTKRILYLDKLVKNVEILDVPYSKFTKDIIDISQCQRLKELNLSYATSTVPISNILLPKSNKLSRVTVPSNIKQISIEYYPGIKHFEYNIEEPEELRSWFAFDGEDVNLTSITIDLRNKWAFEFLEKYAKRGTIENIVFKNTPSTLNINVSLLQLLLDLPTFDFDSKVTLNIYGKVGLILKGKMAKRWGDIDSSSNRVYCVYDSVIAAQYVFDTTSPTIGATGQTIGFTITDVNGVDANNIQIANNNLRISYSIAAVPGSNISGITINSTTGEFTINPGTAIQGKSAVLTIKAYVIGGSQPITDTVTVTFGAYKPAAGDIVYYDGSISKTLNTNKEAIGFIFWSKLVSWLPETASETDTHTQETYDIRVMAFGSLKNVTKIEDQQNIVSGLPLGPCGSVTESQAADYYSSTITVAGQRAVHQIFGTGTAWHADFDGDQDLKSQIKVGNNEFKKPTGTSRSVIKIGQEIPDGESNINLYCGKYTTENAYNYVFTKNSAGNSSLLTRVKNYYTDFPYSQIDTSNYDEIYTYLNTRTNQPALGCVLFPGYVKTHLWYPNGVDPENTEIGAGTWYVPSAQEYSYLVRQKLLQIDDGTVNDAQHIEDWNKSGRYFYEGQNLRDISSKPNVFKTLLKNMKASTLSDFEGINIEFIKNNLSSLRSSTAYSTTYSEKNNNVYVYEDNSSYGSTDGPQWNASGNIGWGYSTKALLSERDIIYPCCRIVKQIDLV